MAADEIQEIPLGAGENPPIPGAVRVACVDMAGKHHSGRTKARKAALDILFGADLLGVEILAVLEQRIAGPDATVRGFTAEIVRGIAEHLGEIDARIDTCLTGDWTLDRMPRVDRCLARIAVWEMDYTDIDARAAISETLALADELSTDDSVKYLNGLLGRAVSFRSGRTNDD